MALVFIDFNKHIDDAGLAREARTIKAEIETVYEEEGSKQDEVWVTAQSMRRIV